MELLLVLFLVALTDKDPALKAHLNAVLGFYRNNRELLRTLVGTEAPSAPSAASVSSASSPSADGEGAAQAEGMKKGPPAEESLKILEAFLKGV